MTPIKTAEYLPYLASQKTKWMRAKSKFSLRLPKIPENYSDIKKNYRDIKRLLQKEK